MHSIAALLVGIAGSGRDQGRGAGQELGSPARWFGDAAEALHALSSPRGLWALLEADSPWQQTRLGTALLAAVLTNLMCQKGSVSGGTGEKEDKQRQSWDVTVSSDTELP